MLALVHTWLTARVAAWWLAIPHATKRGWNLWLAAHLGAPTGFTCSAYAWQLETQGKRWGRFWRPRIDAWFLKHRGQVDHCRHAYLHDKRLQEILHA
jgi:hypothetical protein